MDERAINWGRRCGGTAVRFSFLGDVTEVGVDHVAEFGRQSMNRYLPRKVSFKSIVSIPLKMTTRAVSDMTLSQSGPMKCALEVISSLRVLTKSGESNLDKSRIQ